MNINECDIAIPMPLCERRFPIRITQNLFGALLCLLLQTELKPGPKKTRMKKNDKKRIKRMMNTQQTIEKKMTTNKKKSIDF